ncbi:MAG TPA: DUF2523 domain-containing protein [Methylophilus sp.]
MPLFLMGLLGGLGSIAGSLVGRVLVALGIGYITYQGLDIAISFFQTQAVSYLLSSGYQEVNAALNMLNIGKCINVTFSAIIARNVISGLTGGSITKTVIK